MVISLFLGGSSSREKGEACADREDRDRGDASQVNAIHSGLSLLRRVPKTPDK